ncbi:MAG TPA: virulence factor TspB C-terminal domain-related protein [Noviherbaspirillum sp.]|jgi:hypothetical protein|uniref:virulence factor TspB C-terminal domain-related protein n=1 Tax=Noviherbaspirillum sp. TaxID=1926288 RepID=UPI002F94462E
MAGSQTCKTTVTVGDRPGGGPGTNDSTDDKKDDFCAKHPELNVCRNSTVSGSCAALACQGDAIQCSIARKIHEEACKRQADEDALKQTGHYQLGTQILAGNDPKASELPSPDRAQVVNMPASLNQSGWLGGGQCFPDKTVSVGQFTMVIPFSEACQYLIAFRYLVMLMAALASFRILSAAIFK